MKKIKTSILICSLLMTSLLCSQDLEVWVSDAGGFSNPPWFIFKFDENGENPIEVMSQSDGIEWPEDIIFLEDDGVVLISNLNAAGTISRHNINTGDFISKFAAGLGGPTRMKIGPDDLLYVLQWTGSGTVLRYQLDGTFVDEFTNVGVAQSIGIDWDSSGNLYISSYGNSLIRKFDTSGNDLGLFINSGLNGPTNIFFDQSGSGDLIVFNWNNGIVQRYNSSGVFVENLITGINQCEGFDFMPNGDILIGVGSDDTVKRYDNNFNFIENFIESGTLITPNAVAIRETTLTVTDFELASNFIIPSIGTRFSIKTNLSSEVEYLEIYTISGIFIEKIILNETSFWDASKFSEGVYIIKATTINGKVSTQKVVVKK